MGSATMGTGKCPEETRGRLPRMSPSLDEITESLRNPERLFSIPELIGLPRETWPSAGIYGWWFDVMPGSCPLGNATGFSRWHLLYVGIGPVNEASGRTFRDRVLANHVKGTARNSTLRLSLGSLLWDSIGLMPTPYGGKVNFGTTESALSEWMNAHCRVSWVTHPEPWTAETGVMSRLDLPLNIEHNSNHPFCSVLSSARERVRRHAPG